MEPAKKEKSEGKVIPIQAFCPTNKRRMDNARLRLKPKSKQLAKNEIKNSMGKIWFVINTLAQERRIKSNELDDFNQAYGHLNKLIETMFQTIELMESEALLLDAIKSEHREIRCKMELCLELLGMSKKGIDQMVSYPVDFLEMAMAVRLKEAKPLENDLDFYWLDQLWNRINIQIDNDLDNFNQANFFKQLYHDSNSPDVKKRTLALMNGYAKDLYYLKSLLGKEVEETEVINQIKNFWYEHYRNNSTGRIS